MIEVFLLSNNNFSCLNKKKKKKNNSIMNVDGKFIKGELCISLPPPQCVNCFNVCFGDNITIIASDNGNYIVFLPPYRDRKSYENGFCEETTNNRNEEHKLRDFLWYEPNKIVLEKTNEKSKENIFDKDNMNISINSQDTIFVDMPKRTDKNYSGQLKLKENKSFTITPSTTLTELAKALPELPENIKQAMKKVDNEIKLETGEDTECWNCGCSFDLTKLKFWENKEK